VAFIFFFLQIFLQSVFLICGGKYVEVVPFIYPAPSPNQFRSLN